MIIGCCPRCRTEYPVQVVGFNCGRCLVDENREILIVPVRRDPTILKFPPPRPSSPVKQGA